MMSDGCRVLFAAFLVLVVGVTAPAFAQAPYVAGTVGVDVSRFDTAETIGIPEIEAGGEALAWSLRLGTSVGERWGVELTFTRPSAAESEINQGYPIPLAVGVGSGVPGITVPPDLAFPIFEFSTRLERRHTTFDTVAWVTPNPGGRVELVYVAGLAFSRIVEDVEVQFPRRIVGLIVPTATRTIDYGVGPVVGMEARVALTDHVLLVPGMRLYGMGGTGRSGWLVRAVAGLAWRF